MKKGDIHVLIVDDDKAIGKILGEVITRAGFKATICERADEALNNARLKNFQAAVIDCMLPAMNGLKFTDALRQSRFGEGIVVLMSGVFRDKAFENDALRSTKAIGFLQKPFGPNDLLALLKPKLDGLVENQQWTLQSILHKKIESTRDRLKVVEHLEEIKGVEFAFVLSILADAKVSGSVNLVSEDGNIFGLKLQRGLLNAVDSDTADQISIRYLTDTGYLTQEDLQVFETTDARRGSPLARLVQTGNISPHAGREAQKDQIIFDLKRIFAYNKVNINFSPDGDDAGEATGMELSELFAELNQSFDTLLTEEYLLGFFEEKMPAVIQKLMTFNQDHPVWKFPLVKRIENANSIGGGDTTLKDWIAKSGNAANILKAVYCLVMFRQILFTDLQTIKGFEEEVARRNKVWREIEAKTPQEVFHYFGTGADPKPSEMERVFLEFVKANHPDRLPSDAPNSLRDITTKVFAKVTEAHDILTNPQKFEEYRNRQAAKETEKEIQADDLQREGLDLIRRGSYGKAEEKINQAMVLAPSNQTLCLQIWARLKQTGKPIPKADVVELKKKLEQSSVNDRQNPHFHMALGLLRAAMGDATAIQAFEKAVALNAQFVEARREINSIQGAGKQASGKSAASDLLTGDITNIVSQIFKRKAK